MISLSLGHKILLCLSLKVGIKMFPLHKCSLYKNIPSNYRTIMINHILAKIYGLILEKNIFLSLESCGKRAKWKEKVQHVQEKYFLGRMCQVRPFQSQSYPSHTYQVLFQPQPGMVHPGFPSGFPIPNSQAII